MKFNTIAAAAVAVLALSSASAFAAASATATLTGLTISLGKIKQSGVAPKVTFSSNTDTFETYSYSYDPSTYQYNTSYGNSVAGAGSTTSVSGFSNGSVSLFGDAGSDDGATISLTSFAVGSNSSSGSYTYEFLGLGGYSGGSAFTLGANTFLDISATYSFSTAVTGARAAGNLEYAYANAYLSLTGTNGSTSQSSTSSAGINSQNYGSSYTPNTSETGELDVSFVGSKTKATTGYFYGYVQSYGSSNVSAVPEPTNIALLLAGLGAIAVVSRRRAGR